jgi:hypothetical protein
MGLFASQSMVPSNRIIRFLGMHAANRKLSTAQRISRRVGIVGADDERYLGCKQRLSAQCCER